MCHAGPGLGMCTAVFYSDLAPLLIALGARVGRCPRRESVEAHASGEVGPVVERLGAVVVYAQLYIGNPELREGG